jgi:hypothetical protein
MTEMNGWPMGCKFIIKNRVKEKELLVILPMNEDGVQQATDSHPVSYCFLNASHAALQTLIAHRPTSQIIRVTQFQSGPYTHTHVTAASRIHNTWIA